MKNVLKVILVCLLALFYSCKDNEEVMVVGDCSNPPKLSSEKLIFDKNGGTQEVKVSRRYRIGLNYNNKDLNVGGTTDDLKIIKDKTSTTYKHTDFTVKMYELKVVVTMNENKSKQRKLVISTNAGNCFTGFTVEQKGV